MYKYILLPILFLTINLNCLSQQIHYYSDNFYGGVTGGGFNPGLSSITTTVSLNIPNNATIRKALLFATSSKFFIQEKFLDSINITLNGEIISIGQQNAINNKYTQIYGFSQDDYVEYTTLIKDITHVSSIQNQPTINITSSMQANLPAVWRFYILILYDSNVLSKTSIDVYINNQDYLPQLNYSLIPSYNISYSEDVGLVINTGDICDTINDGSFVSVNSSPIGLIGGNEFNTINTSCSSPSGNFYYENNTLNGLTDDTSDSLMNGTDAIANIRNYGTSIPTEVNFIHQAQSHSSSKTNIVDQLFLTYTSPCDTFSTTLTPDTTICYGETLQLQATGGVSTGSTSGYEWLAISNPAALNDLSCTDCPNPIFSGDSSQVYTVRIWNTDSCSVVKPISIGVSHPSEIISSTFNSVCSFSTGKIKMQDVPSNVVQFGAVNKNGDTLTANSANTFNGLSAGDYTLFYIDKFGCSTDTVVKVEPVINTKALFNAYPKKGTAPIYINLTNQSQNATDYSWWINDAYQGNSFSGFWADTSGTYNIELIAWKTDSICADTVSFTVFIFDSLVASLPNVFTPNNDGVNDYFNVKVNLPVSYKLSILNRWGNLVFENAGDLTKGEHKLWNGETKSGEIVTDGTYFYKMVFGLDRESIDCELTECEVVKQGFVDVRK
ncbi:T9SS type B sorting domain-containing protein [Brumimicrobium oceani]|uniref:Gliding motility-associated C-terminal domain-containing protein n=1 Tax=Brumimicrobium oceani TaxID=2100725 RepID=A0A2U2XD90_9FLAO|nr:gliding motility-associated C-terminal domain-containing protein [Brumimicrobium oceani]PWH85766.1 hypothetical protein DIT68_06645 [Brumimicrobium oceani]